MVQLTKPQLMKAFNAGDFEALHKELTRYGSMLFDKAWETETGYYAGHTRIQKWDYKGLHWESHKLNGEVIRLSYTQEEN